MDKRNQKILFTIACTLFVLVPLFSNSVVSQGIFFVQIAVLGLLLFWAKELLKQDKPKFATTRISRPLLALFLCGLASLFFTNYKYSGTKRLAELFLYILVYFAAVNLIDSEKRLKQLIWIICAGCFGVAVYGIAQYFDIAFVAWELQPWGEAYGRRIFASLGNPNWLASYLTLCFPLVIGLFLTAPAGKGKNFLALLTGTSFFSLLLTKSLSGWLSFGVIFLLFFILLKKALLVKPYQKKLALAILILVIAAAVFSMNESPQFTKDPRPSVERLIRYRASLEMIKDYPLLGVGLGNAPLYADLYIAKFIENPAYRILWPREQSLTPLMRDRAENEYLDTGSEMGLLGLACFVWLIISIFNGHITRINQLKDENSKIFLISTYAALGASLVDCLLGFPLHVVPTAVLFFAILGINSSLAEDKGYISIPAFIEEKKTVFTGAVLFFVFLSFVIFGKQFASDVYFAKGLEFKRLEKDEEAIKMYRQAKKWDASNPKIDLELGISQRLTGDLDGSTSSLERYIEMQPYHTLAFYNLARSYNEKRSYDLAIKYYKKALELKPMLSFLWQQLGQAYLAKGEKDLANQVFAIALDYDPANMDASLGLQQAQGMETEERELNAEEKEINMHFDKAREYLDREELDLAAAEYNKVLKLDPNNSNALSNSAVVYLFKGMAKRAEANLRKALEIDPKNNLAKENLKTVLSGMSYQDMQIPIDRDFVDVPILMYHKIDDEKAPTQYWIKTEEFAKQMEILSKYGYGTITLKDLYNFRYNNAPLPEKPVVITFDDGYRNFYDNAYPVLKKCNFSSTVFLIPDAIGRSEGVYLETPDEPFSPFMDEKIIKRMAGEGVSFGSHSYSHPTLPLLEEAQLKEEIIESKKYFEGLGLEVEFFCYPYGKFTSEIEAKIRDAGYLGAVSAKGGIEEINYADFYALRRILIKGGEDADTTFDFIKRVDPTFTIPDIEIISAEILDRSTSQQKNTFKPKEKILLRINARNKGDSAEISAGFGLKDGKGNVIYLTKKAERNYLPPKNFAFGSTETFEFAIDLPRRLSEGEFFADIAFTDPYGLIEYFSQENAAAFSIAK